MNASRMRESSSDGPAAAGQRRSVWLAALLVLVVATSVNLNTLKCGFTWDDSWLILENERIADPTYVHYLLFERTLWRPVKRLSLMLDYHLWGPDRPDGFHATNIGLHSLACLALFFLVLRLSRRRWLALVTALLFAVHPIHVESVANISHRKESLSLLFLLLAFSAWLRARDPVPPRGFIAPILKAVGVLGGQAAEFAARIENLVLCGVLYLLGMLSKEVGAVMFPVLVVVHELLLVPGERKVKLRRLSWLAAAAVPVLVLFAWKGYLGSLFRRFGPDDILWITQQQTSSYADVVLIAIKAFGISLGLLVLPWPLYLDRTFTLPKNILDPHVLGGLLALAIFVLLLRLGLRRSPLAAFAMAWLGLNLLPVLNIIPLTHWLVAERFLYVPSVGFALLVALGLERLKEGGVLGLTANTGRQAAMAALVLMLAVHFALTVVQNRVWTSSETLWTQTLRFNQHSYRALYGYGLELSKDGKAAEAIEYYSRTLKENPSYPEANYALALLLLQEGRHEEAISWGERHAGLAKKDPEPYMVIGNARFARQEWDLAADAYREAIRRKPTHAPAMFNLANVLSASNRNEEALAVLEQATAVRPGDSDVASLRAEVLTRLGRDALAAWTRALELDPDSRTCLNGLARAWIKAGDRARARALVAQSLAIDPTQKSARQLADWLDANGATP